MFLVDDAATAPEGAVINGAAPTPAPQRMAIFQVSHLTLRDSLAYFTTLKLRGSKAEFHLGHSVLRQ